MIYNNTLNQNNVSIESGTNMCSYQNSIRGRTQLESECTNEIVQKVYKMWGAIPTITEVLDENLVVISQPTFQQEFNASIMIQLAKLKVGVK